MRTEELVRLQKRKRLDGLVVFGEANLRALTGFGCDNGCLVLPAPSRPQTPRPAFITDFRYVPEAKRRCPGLRVVDGGRDLLGRAASALGRPLRLGYEAGIPHSRFLALSKLLPRNARFVDITRDLLAIRAVKTEDEIARLRAAERLDCEIYLEAVKRFRPGMTERAMAAVIKTLMIERGDGEAFDTIVCVGANAAECHHVPDETVWNGREPVLIDMGVKLGGYCSDLTRNFCPKPRRGLYAKVYGLVREANAAAIAAVRPGITGKELDAVARRVITRGGFGRCFGHSLGHGVGLEIHEAPNASRKSDWTLEPGMLVTIEPGVYLEDNLGVRIEDLVLVTEDGCEILSRPEDLDYDH